MVAFVPRTLDEADGAHDEQEEKTMGEWGQRPQLADVSPKRFRSPDGEMRETENNQKQSSDYPHGARRLANDRKLSNGGGLARRRWEQPGNRSRSLRRMLRIEVAFIWKV
jgi:hypothetical protein